MPPPKNAIPDDPFPDEAGLPDVPWERVERFVGQLTHDIRNGLNALELQLTFLGEISTDAEAVEEIKRLRATVGSVTRQLQTLRVATGTVRPYPLEYPAADFFDDLRERLAKQHPGSYETVLWETEIVAGAMLSVDPELTLGSLLELFSNALAFATPEGGPVRVRVEATKERTRIVFVERQAQPPAIPLQDWGRSPLLTTRRGTYGLGLFRVRRSIEAQGGTLEAAYSTENRTLTTEVTLRGVPNQQP